MKQKGGASSHNAALKGSAAISIKKSLLQCAWWQFVQKDVKSGLEFIVDNLLPLGILFRDAFLNAFKYEHEVRILKGTALLSNKPGAMFGKAMTDECYHSAVHATKLLLNLDDWTKPNDADVQACMHLCQQIDALEHLGLFKSEQIEEKEQAKKQEQTEKRTEESSNSKLAKYKDILSGIINFRFGNS